MRGLTLAFFMLFACALVDAAAKDYVETRDVTLDAAGVRNLNIETGAGPLSVTGDPSVERIVATATITVAGSSAEEARQTIEEDFTLVLERNGDQADLRSLIDNGGFGWGRDKLRVELAVTLPERLALSVRDGSGSAEIRGVGGPLWVEDGSGTLKIYDAGSDVVIEDGSGGIEVIIAGGDVRIVDGSGSIRIEGVTGNVMVDDGSGSIRVKDVAADLVISDSGSGSVSYDNVQGRVTIDE